MPIRPLSSGLQGTAKKEINEPDRIEDDLRNIKEWLVKQPHLKIRADDQWIIGFLRGCKFSLQKTKEKIDYYYTMRSLLPEFFTNRDPFLPEIQDILNQGVVLPLPKTENMTGPRMVLLRWNGCDADAITVINLTKVYFMVIDILMKEDDNCMVAGKVIVADYKHFKAGYAFQFTPSYIKKIALCLQSAYPIRIKNICIFNSPSVFEKVYNMGRVFMSEKLRNRMVLYSERNSKKVFNHIPQKFLPKEYGGDNGSVDELIVQWKKKVESYKEWYLENENYRTNEKLRCGQPRTTADIFGVEGSFRKLEID